MKSCIEILMRRLFQATAMLTSRRSQLPTRPSVLSGDLSSIASAMERALAKADLFGVLSGEYPSGDGSSERRRMALAVPLLRFTLRVGGGSVFSLGGT